ncbi:transcription initiation factor IIF subunit alpha-like [Capsella rubella]|uniref:transcription initiation factor IIF subunit alpha-like n=1 Tax=Capsella rubella TaxID=81985 RepID=UPI000CD5075A|nr:transcription initiation factor IIF subunit alpha-like [Capsella rubella]
MINPIQSSQPNRQSTQERKIEHSLGEQANAKPVDADKEKERGRPEEPNLTEPHVQPNRQERKMELSLGDQANAKPIEAETERERGRSEEPNLTEPQIQPYRQELKMEPVTEDEIRNVLMENKQITTVELVMRFKDRLGTKEHKDAFADILKKIAMLQKDAASQKYFVVLRDDESSSTLLSSELTRLSIS